MMNSVAGSATSSAASGSCAFHQSCLWHWSPEVKRDLESLFMEAWVSVVMHRMCRGGVTSPCFHPDTPDAVGESARSPSGTAARFDNSSCCANFSALDPNEAYGRVNRLVHAVTYDLRSTWVKQ